MVSVLGKCSQLRIRGETILEFGPHRGKQDSIPDALVVSVGLWHMLHMTSAPAFKEDLQNLRAAADSFVSWHDQASGMKLK